MRYLQYLRDTTAITPEQWLLKQLPGSPCATQIEGVFKFCVWLAVQFPDQFDDMKAYVRAHKIPTFIDEANNLFDVYASMVTLLRYLVLILCYRFISHACGR